MDNADRANPLIDAEIKAGIERATHAKTVSIDCIECGIYIPDERQQATDGTDLCIDCATFLKP